MSDENGCPNPDCNDPACGPGSEDMEIPLALPLPMETMDALLHMATATKFGPLYTRLRYDNEFAVQLRESVAPLVAGTIAGLVMLGYDVPNPTDPVTPESLRGPFEVVSSYDDVPGMADDDHEPDAGWSN